MYNVSDQYKTDIQSQIRNESYVEIAHVIPNYHNVGDLPNYTTYDTGLFENEVNQYFVRQVQSATFEPMGCVLDGSTYLRGTPTIVGNNESGEYVSTSYSLPTPVGTSMEFDSGFYVTEYDRPTSFSNPVVGHVFNIGLTGVLDTNEPTHIFLAFDTAQLVRPTAFTINMVDNDPSRTVLATADYTPTEFSATYLLPTLTDLQAVELTDIEIVVTALNMPYQYVRFEKVILGIVNEFTDEDITTCEWAVASNPLTFEVPKAEFTFTFLDPDRLYHESNPNTLITAIRENQQVGFRFGYQLESGGTEWLTGGLYRTTGEVTTDDSGIPRVTIKTAHASVNANDLVRELDSTLVSPEDEEVAIDITKVTDLMDMVGVTVTIDQASPTNFVNTLTVVDPNITLKEYAQLMANAHGLMWKVKRDSPYNEDMLLTEFCKLIRTSAHNYDTVGLFTDNEYNTDGIKLFQFNNSTLYSPPNIKTVPKSDGIDYARYNIETNETERKPYPDPAVGTRLIKVDNPFVTCDNSASLTEPNSKFGEYIHDYYGEQNTYVLSNRGFPELDVGDIIQVYANYYDQDGETVLYFLKVQGMIVGNRISYNGSISGETTMIGWESITGKTVMVGEVETYVAGKYE